MTECPRCGTVPRARFPVCPACGAALRTTRIASQTDPTSPSRATEPDRAQNGVTRLADQARSFLTRQMTRLTTTDNEPAAAQTAALGSDAPGTSIGRGSDQPEQTAIVIDRSGSMDQSFPGAVNKLAAAQTSAMATIDRKIRVDPNDMFAVVQFDHQAELVIGMHPAGRHRAKLKRAIDRLTIGGGTNLYAGVYTGSEALDWRAPDIVRRIVMLTDGHGEDPRRIAKKLKARGVMIQIVGVGEDPSAVNEALLRETASVIDGRVQYWFVRDATRLTQTFTSFGNKTRVE